MVPASLIIAPEEFAGTEYDSEVVDTWSMAVIYYVLAFQSIPWKSAILSDPRYKNYIDNRARFSSFERLEPGPRAIMYRMMDPNPQSRISLADVALNDWFRCLDVCTESNSNSVSHAHVIPK